MTPTYTPGQASRTSLEAWEAQAIERATGTLPIYLSVCSWCFPRALHRVPLVSHGICEGHARQVRKEWTRRNPQHNGG